MPTEAGGLCLKKGLLSGKVNNVTNEGENSMTETTPERCWGTGIFSVHAVRSHEWQSQADAEAVQISIPAS